MSVSSFELYPSPPYRLDLTVWALRRRGRNEIDRWDASYRRALLVGGQAVVVRVDQVGTADCPVLRVEVGMSEGRAADLAAVRQQVSRLLGIDVDLGAFYRLADADPRTRALKDRFLGLRPPRFPSLFEALANAVANQQLSLEVGLTLLNRLTVAFGTMALGPEELVAFPTPEAVVAASPDDVRSLGFSASKTEYLQDIAHAISTSRIDEPMLESTSRVEATRRLQELHGVGAMVG